MYQQSMIERIQLHVSALLTQETHIHKLEGIVRKFKPDNRTLVSNSDHDGINVLRMVSLPRFLYILQPMTIS